MKFRPHQQIAFDKIWNKLQSDLAVLLEAACSAGKTFIFCEIAHKLLEENPDFRVLILVDREILIKQIVDTFEIVAPDLLLDIGIVCAGLSSEKELEKRITIATRQSLTNCMNEFSSVNLIIVDECHLLGMPKEGQLDPVDQFGTIIETIRGFNPNVRLFGVTATPYRIGTGYIYGEKNRPGSRPYFPELTHKITVKELQDAGYLALLIGKTILDKTIENDIENVSTVAGEYNLGQLSGVMMRSIHIKSAVEAWKEHAQHRNKTLVYCVTIEHAELLSEAFNEAGIKAMPYHSKLNDMEEMIVKQELHDVNSEVKIFCSVAQLTTGMDVPSVDCIEMVRATKSTALYKQILGRGQRIFPGKENCLVLDLVGNNAKFGTNLDNLKVSYAGADKQEKGEMKFKECPQCQIMLHPAVRICPECQYAYPKEQFQHALKPNLVNTHYGEKPLKAYPVKYMFTEIHISKKTKKELLKVRFILEKSEVTDLQAQMFFCFSDYYKGFAVTKGKENWEKFTDSESVYPENVEEALMAAEMEFKTPSEVVVDLNSEFPDIRELIFDKEVKENYPPGWDVEEVGEVHF